MLSLITFLKHPSSFQKNSLLFLGVERNGLGGVILQSSSVSIILHFLKTSRDTKGHIRHNSISMKCPELSNLQRQEADWWMPGAGSGSSNCLMGTGFHLGVIKMFCTLAGMAQWIEHLPVNQRVAGSIPSHGTCLGCGPGPRRGRLRGNHTWMFLSPSPFLSV